MPDATSSAVPSTPPDATAVPEPPAAGEETAQVDVQISYGLYDEAAAEVQVAGYAAVVEDAGTCTLLLTSGSHRATVSGPAAPDASTMTCGTLAIPRAELPTGGTWTAELSYRSASSSGTAPTVTIGLP